ncbi:MAG TPA: type VI secretion system tube protein Hcp, partial [Tepidisphaeraceae bacterium]|nr:type VI secretion system tube protein Hcp [Tepidisphaeraceae bacterium]
MSAFVRRRHRRWDRIGSFGVDVLEGRVLLAATPLATQSSFFSVNTGSSAGPATFAGATVLPSGAKHLLSFDNSATFLPLQTYSFAFSKTITIAGGAGGITESKINVTPLSITLSERLGTAGAFVSMLSGSVANQVSLLDFDKQGKQYTKWDFSDVTVSSYSVSAGGASDTGPIPLPTEAIQLSFDKVQLSNIDPNTGVVVGTPITWKLDTATPGAALAASVNSPVATAAAVPAPKPNSTQMIVDPNGNATAFDLDTASLGTARNTVTEFSATLTNPLQMVPMLANVLNGIFQTVTTTAYDSATKPLVTWEMNDADFTSVSVSASAGQNPLTSLTTAAVKVTQTTPDNSQSPAPTPDVWSFDQAARTVTGTASFAGPATIPVTQAEHTLADPGVGSGLLPVYSTQLGSQNNAGTKVLSGFSLQTDLTIGSAGLMADAVRG